MTDFTLYILNHWKWNKEETELLLTLGYGGIEEKFDALDEKTYDCLCDCFTSWLAGDMPKARLNYWMRKTGINEAMLNIWHTH